MNEVIEFIKRRFPVDCKWLDGNCYYFALILKDRFAGGKIFYDVLNCHFVFFYEGKYYDWTGEVSDLGYLVEWDNFDSYDLIQKQRIIDCCLK